MTKPEPSDEEPTARELAALAMRPSQLYHFATPRIFRQKRAPFEPACLDEMMRVYNTAFYELSQFCLERGDAVAAFYPSTSAIDEAPRDTLEYVMAKIAGETLARTVHVADAPVDPSQAVAVELDGVTAHVSLTKDS